MNFIKNLWGKITHKANTAAASFCDNAKEKLNNIKGDGYVSDGLRVLIAVVLGALLLAGLYALFNSTILPTVTAKVQELFNYAG